MRGKRYCGRDCKARSWRAVRRATRASKPVRDPRPRSAYGRTSGRCVVCGAGFIGHRDRRFCSQRCVDAARLASHPEREHERNRQYRQQNAIKLANRRKTNREHARDYARQYRARNREKLKAYQRNYRRKNPAKFREWQRRHDERFRELRREAKRRWRQEHPAAHAHVAAARRARELAAPGKHTLSEWLALLERCDYRCRYCGQQSGKLTRDHDVPLIRGGSHAMENIRPACARCNSVKGRRTGVEVRAQLARETGSTGSAA
jgi:predicted nucleic acid-binding Zn ribbon protein